MPITVVNNDLFTIFDSFLDANDTKKKLVIDPNFDVGFSFGKKVAAVPSTEGINKYKYNGKELQEEFDLIFHINTGVTYPLSQHMQMEIRTVNSMLGY